MGVHVFGGPTYHATKNTFYTIAYALERDVMPQMITLTSNAPLHSALGQKMISIMPYKTLVAVFDAKFLPPRNQTPQFDLPPLLANTDTNGSDSGKTQRFAQAGSYRASPIEVHIDDDAARLSYDAGGEKVEHDMEVVDGGVEDVSELVDFLMLENSIPRTMVYGFPVILAHGGSILAANIMYALYAADKGLIDSIQLLVGEDTVIIPLVRLSGKPRKVLATKLVNTVHGGMQKITIKQASEW